jgi:hypothetical protein
MLVHLPGDHGAITVREGLLAAIKSLPEHLAKTLTWIREPSWPSTGR